MQKKEFTYLSSDGEHKIRAVLWTPDGEVKAVLQLIHGMAEYIDRYEDFAAFLCGHGFAVTGNDHLGHGPSAKESDLGYFTAHQPADHVVEDVHLLYEQTKKEYPLVPYFLFGHSMGSFVIRNYLGKYSEDLSGAIICGTGYTPGGVLGMARFMSAIKTAFGGGHVKAPFINAIAFGSYNARIKPAKTVNDWLSVNEENVNRYREDKLCGFTFTGNGFRTLFGLIAGCQKASCFEGVKKDLPILMVAGGEDPVGAYGSGVKTVYEKYKAAGVKDIDMILYDGQRHEILNDDAHEKVYEDLLAFLTSKSSDSLSR